MSDEKQEKMVLCGANSYDMKYYFNEKLYYFYFIYN